MAITTPQKSKFEIIMETALFYGEDPSRRSLEVLGSCKYQISNEFGPTHHCAIGRVLCEEFLKVAANYVGNVRRLSLFLSYEPEVHNKEGYRSHSIYFWTDLQRFHDNSHYYTDKGFTLEGTLALAKLVNKYSDSP